MTAVSAPFARPDYNALMAAIEAGEPVSQDFLDAGTAFAKAKKIKAPKGAVIAAEVPEDLPAEPAITPVKKAGKKESTRVKNAGVECSKDGCKKGAVAKGLCSADYAAARRQDPEEKAKANEASKAYYARQRAAAKAAAEKLAAKKAAKAAEAEAPAAEAPAAEA